MRVSESGASAPPIAVFCDFDGTMTERDMVVSIAERFCPPTWRTIAEAIVEQRKTVREGVAEIFAMIPSSKADDLVAFAQGAVRWRAGLPEFLDFCRRNGLRLIVCSGNLDFVVTPLLAPFRERIDRVVTIPADLSAPTIRLRMDLACESEALCKAKIIEEYPQALSILIGDSITDLHGARRARVVFARPGLGRYLDSENLSYYSFETFNDILDRLSRFQGPHAHAEKA